MGTHRDSRDDPTATSPSLSTVAESSAAYSQTGDTRPRKKTSTACSVCKKRKTKCSGEYPCDRCIQRGTIAECVIDSSADMRRRGVSQRRTEELESDRRLLDGIIETIRTGTDEQVQALCNMIRDDTARADLLDHLDNLLQSSAISEGSAMESPQPSSPQNDRHVDGRDIRRKPRGSLHDLLNHGPENV